MTLNKTKDFWGMSRRERRGTIVVLLAIALILTGIVISRGWREALPVPSTLVEQAQFDAVTDSVPSPAVKSHDKPSRSKHPSHRRDAKKRPARKSPPPSSAPVPMQPVPQF